jgi:uncharacterized RDD family membrane protein YckC
MSESPPAAGLWRRLAAACYDLLLLVGVVMLTSFGVVVARGGNAVPAGDRAFQVFVVVQVAAFFIMFWSRGGQTLGMRAWRIRVQMQDGGPLRTTIAACRFAAALLSAAALGLGFLWIAIDRDSRAWHDRLAGTRVVRLAPPGRSNA